MQEKKDEGTILEAINLNAEKKQKLVIIMRLFLVIDLVFIISPIFKKMLKD